jgi:hypothetical protein
MQDTSIQSVEDGGRGVDSAVRQSQQYDSQAQPFGIDISQAMMDLLERSSHQEPIEILITKSDSKE